jgi:O-6-methylguanine DNA methyltransferase
MTHAHRELEPDLAALGVSAPPTLAPDVLVEVGLADRYATMESPVGALFVAWNGLGVSEIGEAADDRSFEAAHASRTSRPAMRAAAIPASLGTAIARRLAGDRRARVPLDLRGHTPFERDVWTKALEIPHGEVRPYGWIAAEIGRPKAVRAVGTALGHNPVPLVVPCHRVVRSDGTIGQYSLGGPQYKRAILAAEGVDPDALESLARRRIRYIGSTTTRVVCLPTCHNARRISERHRTQFRSLEAAADAGFRPCRACRPRSAAGVAAA